MGAGLFFKFLKFCLVGCSGMIVDFGTTWLLKEKIRINKYIANSCGFVLAACSNFFWNRIWTFQSHSERVTLEFLSFFSVAVLGLAINNLILWLCTDKLKMNFYFSKIIAIGIVTLWNFGMNFLYTFH